MNEQNIGQGRDEVVLRMRASVVRRMTLLAARGRL